jgi:hypothetical protein
MKEKAIKRGLEKRIRPISPITAHIENPFDSLFGCLFTFD